MERTQHELEILARVKDEASANFGKVGSAGVGAASDIDKAFEKMSAGVNRRIKQLQDSMERTRRVAQQVGSGIGMATGTAALGFASVRMEAEDAGLAIGGLAAQVGGAFAMGGPILGGIALVTAGIGAIVGASKKAREEMKKLGEAAEQAAQKQAAAAKQAEQSLLDSTIALKEMKAERDGLKYDAWWDRNRAAIEEATKAVEKHFDAYQDAQWNVVEAQVALEFADEDEKAARQAILDSRQREFDELNKTQQAEQDHLNNLKEQRTVRGEILRQQQAEERRAKVLADLEKTRAAEAEKAAKEKAARDAENEAIMAREDAALQALDSYLFSMSEEGRALTQEFGAQAGLAKELQELYGKTYNRYLDDLREAIRLEKERKQAVLDNKAELQRAKQAQASTKAVERRLEVLKAETEVEKRLVRWEQEREDLIAQGVDEALVTQLHAQELANDLKAQAEAEREKLDAQREFQQGLQDEIDLTGTRNEDEREYLQLIFEENRVREQGGEKAVELARELLEVRQQMRHEAEAEQRAQAELQRLMSGGHVDKGLASRRAKRRAETHIRKRRRELAASGRLGDEDAGTTQYGALPEDQTGGGGRTIEVWQRQLEGVQAEFEKNQRELGIGQKEVADATGQAADAGKETADASKDAADAAKRSADAQERAGGAMRDQAAALNATEKATQDLLKMTQDGTATTERIAELMQRLAEEHKNSKADLDKRVSDIERAIAEAEKIGG